jgi:hypothetical protein
MENCEVKSMKKIIIPALIFILLSAFSLAYTVVDYEPFNYSGGQDVLYNYNWRNATSGGLPFCSATSGYLSCSGATTNYRIAHILNSKPTGYCLSKNGSYGDFGSNFSIRFNLKLTESIKSSADLVSVYTSAYVNSTTTSWLYDLESRTYANYSVSQGEKYYLATAGGYSYNIYNTLNHGNWHTVQMDFYVTNATSPVGAQNIYAGNISMINDLSTVSYYFTSTNSFALTDYYCLNATTLRFNTDFNLDDLYVIQYNTTEKFLSILTSINTSNATPPTSYQCSDGSDNDLDGYIDYPQDPSCTSINDTTEDSFDDSECNDLEDNDGDGLIDYPEDPACTGAYDNSESPYSYFQCNDKMDNDGDGLIDYPQDPSCSNFSDNFESPADATTQGEDSCEQNQLCVFFDSFPYSDSIYFHGWTDSTANKKPNLALMQGSYSLLLVNQDINLSYNFNLKKNFTNSMALLGDTFTAKIHITLDKTGFTTDVNEFYFILDGESNTSIVLKFVANFSDDTLKIYNINSTFGAEFISQADNVLWIIPQSSYEISFLLNLADYTYSMSGKTFNFFSDVVPISARLSDNGLTYDSTSLSTYINYISISAIAQTSSCTSFSPPYYLKEDFNSGYLKDCGWTISPSDFSVAGKLQTSNSLPFLSLYKFAYDTVSKQNVQITNQYTTVSFDFNIYSNSTAENALTFSILDTKSSALLNNIFTKNGDVFSFKENLGSFSTDTEHNYKIIIDLISDNYEVYIDNALVKNNAIFDTDYNFDNIRFVYFASANSKYSIDNLNLYISDSNGFPTAINQNIIKNINNETTWFGLIYRSTPACTIDSDCASGSCTNFGKCSSFNYKKCDAEGYERGSYCMIGLTMSGFFGWVADIALDNFLYVILFMILLVIALFIWKLTRREG